MPNAVTPIKITKLHAREILDSRGFPTVEAELWAEGPNGIVKTLGLVPSGASTGENEALELRDDEPKRFLGKGVLGAVQNIKNKIAPAVVGREFARQSLLDDHLRELDGSFNKSNLGANAILGVSIAFCRAMAAAQKTPDYKHISTTTGDDGVTLPVPLMNILNGGKHADNQLDIQEFMIAPAGFKTFKDALRAGVEVFHHLKKILKHKGLSTSVGDEGGFAPDFDGNQPHEQALTAIVQAIGDAGYKPGKEIFLALDSAASEFVEKHSAGNEKSYLFEGQKKTSSEMVDTYVKWAETYPILSIEDGLSEHDWEGWAKMTRELGGRCQLVGDDLFVTNAEYLQKGINEKVGNSILIKLNQIGTVTETLETIKLAKKSDYSAIVSHRSGETEDAFIADLAVGSDCGQIKTGSASRADRTAKYNRLIRIEEELGTQANFAGKKAFLVLG